MSEQHPAGWSGQGWLGSRKGFLLLSAHAHWFKLGKISHKFSSIVVISQILTQKE